VKIHWEAGSPENIVALVDPLVAKWKHLFPHWLNEFEMFWREHDDCKAEMTVTAEYRRASLKICPGFITSSPAQQEHIIVHEFCHCYTCPITAAAIQAIQKFFPDSPTPGTEIAEMFIRERMEACTEDLALMLERG
jgi:hypothetical protein